jgi:uncharacterized membrane protein
MTPGQTSQLNALLISVDILLIAGFGLTLLFKKRLNEKQFKSVITSELAAFLLILIGYLILNPDGWVMGFVNLALTALGIVAMLVDFSSWLGKDK